MSNLSKSKWAIPWLLLLLVNGLILLNAPPSLRYPAALLLLAILPGWAWLPVTIQGFTRMILAIGLSLCLTILGTMIAVYWPGTISLPQLLIIINTIIVLGFIINPFSQSWATLPQLSDKKTSTGVLFLALLLLLTALLRLPRLEYAEFHEDEAEALMLGVRLLQGEDYALFLHRKGPAQMLLPLAFWLMTDQISEAMARFPFALSSILSVATLFVIGRHWFGWPAGLIAGLLWASNGYAIGFGRMVQYQALIFFLGPLALYCLYLAGKLRQSYWLIVAVLLLATSLLAHFDALLLLPAAGYLFLTGNDNKNLSPHPLTAGDFPKKKGVGDIFRGDRRYIIALISALILFIAVLSSFYLPYILDPEFSNTTTYLTESRVKPGLLYNNLNLLRRLDQDYSSQFYLPLLVVGLLGFIGWQSKTLNSGWRWGLFGGVLLALTTYWSPVWWRIGSVNLAILPWLGLGIAGFWHFRERHLRAVWLMTGGPLIGYLFLVDDPRTHLYILYPGLVLLAGAGWGWLMGGLEAWQNRWISENSSPHPPTAWAPSPQGEGPPRRKRLGSPLRLGEGLGVRTIFRGLAAILIGSIIFYEVTIFLQSESFLDRLRLRWAGSWWETVYDDLPEARQYFGYPKREGWKAIGALRTQGQFVGDFRSVDEDFIVPIWYNYGQARSCYDTPAHFFVRSAEATLPANEAHYHHSGQIQREGVPRLQIFSSGAATNEPPTLYRLENLSRIFDQQATPQRFAQQTTPTQPLDTQFGPAIQLSGYDLPTTTLSPGETLRLNLYWFAVTDPVEDYRVFVHLTDGNTLWAQQDDNPACRLPTSIWRMGQHGVGQFRLTLPLDIPPGRYPLIIGLYQSETLERLSIVAGAGQVGDDFLWVGDVQVR